MGKIYTKVENSKCLVIFWSLAMNIITTCRCSFKGEVPQHFQVLHKILPLCLGLSIPFHGRDLCKSPKGQNPSHLCMVSGIDAQSDMNQCCKHESPEQQLATFGPKMAAEAISEHIIFTWGGCPRPPSCCVLQSGIPQSQVSSAAYTKQSVVILQPKVKLMAIVSIANCQQRCQLCIDHASL